MAEFSSLGLCDSLVNAVAQLGYSTASPIQAKTIPMVLTGRDVMASAQTGTGKTASYTLPMLQRLSDMKVLKSHPVRALVLVPTRELAIQVGESVDRYRHNLSDSTGALLTSTVIYGGVDMAPQVTALESGRDVLIATPGRLLDLLSKQHLTLGHLKILVLDEADRMLDLGFKPDIERILADAPVKRQNLLFSATFSKTIKQLANDFLRHPVKIEIENPNSAANTVKQSVYPVDQKDKPEVLSYLIEGGKWEQALVFVRTKKAADKVADLLFKEGISATSLHSDKSQHIRSRTLVEFQAGAYRVLVATDVAARGLDIEQLPLVVNYDLPKVPQDYVHRIGRTGRAGAPGRAISLMNPEEKKLLDNIRMLIKRPLNVEPVPYFDDAPGTTLHNSSGLNEHPARNKPARKPTRKKVMNKQHASRSRKRRT